MVYTAHEILQARILEVVAFPFSGDLPHPVTEPRSPTLRADSLAAKPWGKPKKTGVVSLPLLQGIFPTQESDWGLLRCRGILTKWATREAKNLTPAAYFLHLETPSLPIREGNGPPLQCSCLENPMGGGAWWAAVHGIAKSWAQPNDFTFSFHFHALEKAMATHSSVLAWRIPGTGEPGGLQSMGSLRVRHDWATSLSLFTFMHLEKAMAAHSSVLAWRIPGTEEPGGLRSMGSHRVGHDWSDLAAAAAASFLSILSSSLFF